MRPPAAPPPPISAYSLLGLVLTVLLTGAAPLLAGCASSAVASDDDVRSMSGREVAATLRTTTRSWEGTPYRMGGTTRHGIDCSGFAQRLYHDAFGVQLPRSTRTQVRQGRPVPKDSLRPGDLIFFRTGTTTRHVGVYVGKGEFSHASTSEGVTITRLKNEYWKDTYWTARRVLPNRRVQPIQRVQPAPPVAEAPSAPPTTSLRVPERVGW